MKKYRFLAAAFVLAASVSAATSSAAARDAIRVATTKSSGSATIYIAKDRGYFDKEGLDVSWTYFENQNDLTSSVIAGQNDVATAGLIAGFYNVAAKQELRVIAGLISEKPHFQSATFVVTPAAYEKGLRAPKDLLKGARIGIATKGSAHQFALFRLADKYGVDPNTLKIVTMQSNGNILAALQNNAVDAAVMSAVPAATAAAAGAGKIVGYVGDETPGNGPSFFTRADVIGTKRDEMVRFLRAMLQAAKDYDAAFQQLGPDGKPVRTKEADDILAIVSKYTEQPVSVISGAMTYIDPKGGFTLDEMKTQIATWQEVGMVDRSVTADKLLDTSLLDEAISKKSN
ncbi:ABC transporter substrate-binding protein [Rhizobium sp. 1AS11]|uniref:ABC transporter substrate-binding protein n=1 Tax=Rhizobium acaciae TaxID=2989736 RepID=UPI002222740F|nr:ABC transporter substrate-binding protein [Rhizobium acaciae]MCW1411297.1 ABC transporter substrate-binding protein [Rhizobium acaciae]MCW1743291.1 ABC transporter substrate-binding protein [Rhizobium acaciae]